MVASGRVQMAIDRWLLVQYRQGLIPPTIRFYTWWPAAISVGYHQRQYPPHWHEIGWQERPLEIVRRPTGGRGVLHQGDLTYAVVMSDLGGTSIETYQKICQFLIDSWRRLGVNLDYGEPGRGYIHNSNCFETATGADLVTTEGYKLIGSAQLRQAGAVLQHGSMRLNPDADLFEKVFGKTLMRPQLPLATDRNAVVNQAIDTLQQTAQSCFNINLQTQPLTSSEWRNILAQIEGLSF